MLGVKINGRRLCLPVASPDTWDGPEKQHCSRESYKHKRQGCGRGNTSSNKNTLSRAAAEAEWAEINIPPGTSDLEYIRIMDRQFGKAKEASND